MKVLLLLLLHLSKHPLLLLLLLLKDEVVLHRMRLSSHMRQPHLSVGRLRLLYHSWWMSH